MSKDTSQNIAVVRGYFEAVERGDLEAAGNAFAEDIVWHQPGNGSLSGTYEGTGAVFGLLGKFMERSAGSFRIDKFGPFMAQGDLVTTTLHFSAARESASMSMAGVDLLRLRQGKIQEVWLFSEDQNGEDKFWG